MLLFLLSWRFASRDDLEIACQVCKSITARVMKDPDALNDLPESNGFCRENPQDKLCTFIADVVNQVNLTDKPQHLCRNMMACPQLPANYEGRRCKHCLKMTMHVMSHARADRKEALFRYCMTRHIPTLSFCGEVIDGGVDDFLEDIFEMENAANVCSGHGYCRAQGKKSIQRRKAYIGDDTIEIFVL